MQEIEIEQEPELRRGLKNRHVQFIALGFIIDSGYFLGNSYAISQAGPASIVGYLLGGMIVMLVMLCYRELMLYKPVTGSFITYAKELISPTWACGIGWCYWVQCVTPSEPIAAGIIMNVFVPQVGAVWWAVFFCLLVTILNMFRVETFGETEFWLSIAKIGAIILFSVVAALIAVGWIGNAGYIGSTILMGNGGFAPNGWFSVLLVMLIVLGNYQGAETIGLTAGESIDPEKSLPRAVKNVTRTIVSLYTIPVLLLVVILPWDKVAGSENAFGAALAANGFGWLGGALSVIVLSAALSASNSDMFACTRLLYSLQKEGFAPKFLGKLNRQHVPHNAALVSIVVSWFVLFLYAIDRTGMFYEHLILLSGFAGEVVWITICVSQLRFRKRFLAQGGKLVDISHSTPYFPYLTWFAIIIQLVCIAAMMFSEEMRTTLWIGVPAIVIPAGIYYANSKGVWTRIWQLINQSTNVTDP
ncbi:MAG: amino acid permease [Bacillota bacterium]